ncbi:cyanophycinase [Streptomyces sp. NPDC058964]|uniref:cyanophycinase n=1 Tax=Streptomyces sp. NPDC058964 TaxID=3346681 RepID=UPI00368CA6D1
MGSPAFLIGGGWAAAELYEPFLSAAGDAPRIGCVVLDEGDGQEQFARYEDALRKAGDCTPVPLLVPLGGRFAPESAAEVDGVLVCGGLTPAYQEAFAGCLEELPRLLAERGVPYAGFSAGAAVAGRHAVVGGWLLDGVPVCPEDTAEDLAEIDVRPGLGLVPFGVDVHAAQWGTLPRLVAAVARGYVPYGVAIDENTLVEVDAGGHARVSGLGRAHALRPADRDGGGDGGVVVKSYRAGESVPLR